MKINSLYKLPVVVAVCAAALLGTSCTDEWNDHYEVASATEGISSASLWSALSEQSNLSNFVSVVKACGFDEQLGGSQTFTVFAPTNDVFSSTEAQELIAEYQAQKSAGVKDDDNTVIKQFIKNHISLYKHPISSLTNDSITMMNGKYQMLTSSAIGESPLITTNGAFSNGLLNTIGQQIEYFPNVFEYLGINENLDSVYNFINSYSVYEFNPSKSVAGGIVDGQIIYLDSVSTLKNALMSSLSWAKINDEDSTYWMLAPTNDQWNALVAEREQYFNYDNTVNKRDSLQWAGTRYSIINGTAFSRTVNPDVSFQDSAQSTNALSYSVRTLLGINNPYGIFYKPFQAGGIFANNEDVECSNGHVRIPAEWPIKPTDTFLREIITEAEYLQNQDTIINAQDPLTTVSVPSGNPFYDKISGNQYVEVVPTNTSVNPTVTFNISDVLSNVGYDVYIVFAPALAGDTLASAEDRLPNYVRAFIGCNDQTGKLVSERVGTTFSPEPDKVDTVLIAENYKFPTCSYGLAEPQASIQLRSVVSSRQTTTYSRTLRLDCFILKPHQEEATEAKRKQSK